MNTFSAHPVHTLCCQLVSGQQRSPHFLTLLPTGNSTAWHCVGNAACMHRGHPRKRVNNSHIPAKTRALTLVCSAPYFCIVVWGQEGMYSSYFLIQ